MNAVIGGRAVLAAAVHEHNIKATGPSHRFTGT
jgi:hypothetical protein